MKDLHTKLVKAFQEADCYDNEGARAGIAVGIFNEYIAFQRKEWIESMQKNICRIAQVEDWEKGVFAMQRRIGIHQYGASASENEGLGMVIALTTQIRILLKEE